MGDTVWLMHGDCTQKLAEIGDGVVDALVTDPPYDLTPKSGRKGFMEAEWDGTGVAFSKTVWKEAYRVMKPGAWAFIFGATRTFHRMAVAVEDSGFEIRDTIHWTYVQGMPKSVNIALALDKDAGVQGHRGRRFAMVGGDLPVPKGMAKHVPITDEAKEWDGWGTALRATHELILVARKPPEGTLLENVRTHGTGAMNVEAGKNREGLWPTNTVFSCECDGVCQNPCPYRNMGVDPKQMHHSFPFFRLEKKPNGAERGESTHPTLKPVALMKWLIELATRKGGVVLDPFMGSGTTGVAAVKLGRMFVGVELVEGFFDDAQRRIEAANG